jgi:phosphatidate cytidylyltransferase
MLGWRLAMSALLIPTFAALFWVDHRFGPQAPLLYALCLCLGVRCAWEMQGLLKPRFPEIRLAPMSVGIVALVTAAWLTQWVSSSLHPPATIAMAWALVVMGLMAVEAWRFEQPGARMETLGAHVLTVSYIGGLLALTALLRWVQGANAGYYVLASMVISTKMGDVGAYTLGRLFGKWKMAPHLSPGKTWAGFVGALAGGALGAWVWLTFGSGLFAGVSTVPSASWSLMYGLVLGFVGLIGDLCESLIKRDMGQKDAAALMPGFGGLLDLLDSILFAGPVACCLWTWLPP